MNKTVRIAIFAGLGVLLVAVAAFAAGRLFNQGPAGALGPLGLLRGGSGGPGVFQSSIKLQLTPAPELPVEEPAMRGLLSHRDDDKLYIGSVKSGMAVAIVKGSGGGGQEVSPPSPEFDGPLTEVVVTHDTTIYRDDTFSDMSKIEVTGEQVLDQKVVLGTLDEIGENSSITVWGKKVGDRIVADVLLYSSMVVFRSAGGK